MQLLLEFLRRPVDASELEHNVGSLVAGRIGHGVHEIFVAFAFCSKSGSVCSQAA
jgi:hypothetical protein